MKTHVDLLNLMDDINDPEYLCENATIIAAANHMPIHTERITFCMTQESLTNALKSLEESPFVPVITKEFADRFRGPVTSFAGEFNEEMKKYSQILCGYYVYYHHNTGLGNRPEWAVFFVPPERRSSFKSVVAATVNVIFIGHMCPEAEEFLERLNEILDEMRVEPQDEKNEGEPIFAMFAGSNGTYISPLGPVGADFEPNNYMPEVVDAFNTIVEDLLSDSPKGRVSILNGPPGTGKTNLVKAIMQEVGEGASFVMVNPDDVRNLTSPAGVSMLASFVNNNKACSEDGSQPTTVLVLEDADSVLVPRGTDNMSSVSSLLNLTDGIWGAALNIRVLATTNADSLELDPAIVRPGRLTTKVTIGKLSPERAGDVYTRLTGETRSLGSMTLAEVYGLANGSKVKEEKRGFGF